MFISSTFILEIFYLILKEVFIELMKSNARKKTKFRDAASGGRGMRSPPSFFKKIEKKCPDFGKNALIVFISGLNFSFKMLFQEYQEEKTPKFIFARPFFYVS